MKPNLPTILLCICLSSLALADKSIDTFNILFPQAYQQSSGKSLELVTTETGCFDWTSSSPEIVAVTGLSSDDSTCFRKGVVELKHVGPYSASVYITATNTKTQELSNIPVRIRPITKIEIIAKSKMMNINEIQDLSIFAYDKDQNMFTSLEGLKFEWQLVENSNILSKISLKNSHLRLPLNERKNIEMKGAESDILVIKGDSPGKAIVRVKCIEPGYEHLKHQITVSVQERFDINPSLPTYVIVNSEFKFGLITPTRQDILIPKSYYKTTLSSSKFKVSDTLLLNSPASEGETVLKVEDVRTVPPYSADVTIYAKNPTKVTLNLDEYLIVGEETKVDFSFFWNNQLLHGSIDDAKIISDLPYDPVKKTIKGTSKRTVEVKVSRETLSDSKKVTVVYPLKAVLPSNKIILPVQETFELKILGGSGLYEYKIQEGDFASISSSGIISSKKQGTGKIVVIDKKISRNRLTLELVVSQVNSLSTLEAHKELNVNEFGPVFTVGKTKNYEQYTKCNEQNIMLETSHLPIFETSNEVSFYKSLRFLEGKMAQSSVVKSILMKNALLPLGVEDFVSKFSLYTEAGESSVDELTRYAQELENYGFCSAHWIKGSQEYDDLMEVYFKKNSQIRNKFNLRVYQKISNNINKEASESFIMTPLSSLDWKILGGSYKWEAKTKTFLNDVEYNTEYPIVRCPDKEAVLEMKIQKINPESSKLLFPVNQTKKIYIQCKYPAQIKIQYEKPVFDSKIINGLKDQIVKGKLIPFDAKGQQFFNSSNLIYESEKTAGKLKLSNDQFEFDAEGAKSAKVVFWTQKINGLSTKFNRVSTEFGYNGQEMFEISPLPEKHHLVTLFNQKTPYIFRLMKISENSLLSCEGSIECQFSTPTKEVSVKTTRLGSGKMTITDKSIYAYPSLIITFQVVDADRIVLSVSKSSAQVQKKLTAQVSLYYQDELIPTWQYDFRNLLLVHEAGIRSKELITALPSGPSNLYEISTEKPGVYRLVAEQHEPKYLESAPVSLKVYQKFEANIPNLVQTYTPEDVLHLKGDLIVAVNCARKLYLHGGPDALSVTSAIQDDDFASVQISQENSREIFINGLQEGNTKITLTVKSTVEQKLTISVLEIQVTVKAISNAVIHSLQDAIVNAQFRILPYLIVDGEVMVDSVCDFEYKWTSGQQISLHGLNMRRLGINATAVVQGESFIKLQVLKNSKVLFSENKKITVHKSLDIELPTIIGQKQNAISANLLLPPNSGIDFESNIYVTKISQCDENMLSITQNKLITSREKGMVSIKLQKTNDNSYNNYMNVIMTEIKALFIENSHSQVVAEMGKVTQVKFHVQDMYGRLFHNNLFNVEYKIMSSNEDVFTVSIDPTKNYINIHPKKEGEAKIVLRLDSSDGKSGYEKLLEIPHDIVSVEVGKIIEPHSPIYLIIGGQVDIQYSGMKNSKWSVVSGGKFVQINPSTKKITGLRLGEAVISIGGHEVIVRVIEPIIKRKIVQKPAPGKPVFIAEYLLAGRWQEEDLWLPSISNTYGHINNNMNLSCESPQHKWFNIKTILTREQNRDKLRCELTMNHNVEPEEEDFPDQIEVRVVDSNIPDEFLNLFKEFMHDTFWLPRGFKQIFLSSEKLQTQFYIKTKHKLVVDVIGGQESWLTSEFDSDGFIEIFSLKVEEKNTNYDFKIKISHPKSDQTQEIVVKYITDESSRHAEETKKQTVEEETIVEESKQSKVEFGGWFKDTHWTDFIIVIMGVVFMLILVSQKCMGSEGKYHSL